MTLTHWQGSGYFNLTKQTTSKYRTLKLRNTRLIIVQCELCKTRKDTAHGSLTLMLATKGCKNQEH